MNGDRDVAHRFVPSTEPGYEHTCALDGCGCLEHDEEHTGGEGIDPPPRIYTPDATGRCMVCARPEAEHSRSGGWKGDEARCMPAVGNPGVEPHMVALAQRTAAAFLTETEATAETVTDDELLDFADEIRALTVRALGEDGYPPSHLLVKRAKADLVAAMHAINARAKGGR